MPGKYPEPWHLVTCLVISVLVTLEEFLASEGWSRAAAQYPIGLRPENNPVPVPAGPGGELF